MPNALDSAASASTTLDDLAPGQHGTVARLVGPSATCRRLAEMGLVPGVTARVERVAPLGDPIEIGVRGYRLSLRRDQARCLGLGSPPAVPAVDGTISSEPTAPPAGRPLVVAMAGNPNAGKTTLFNAITGLRQEVANYPGSTVDRKEGRAPLPGGGQARLIDLPGIYSLVPASPDERIAVEVLAGLRADTPTPDVVLAVVDATNLARNLLLVTQLLDTGIPVVVALTMVDEARQRGLPVEPESLAERLGVPVVAVVARSGEGLVQLGRTLGQARSVRAAPWRGPGLDAHDALATTVRQQATAAGRDISEAQARLLAWGLLAEGDFTGAFGLGAIEPLTVAVAQARRTWAASGIDPVLDDLARRYAWIDALLGGQVPAARRLPRDRIDGVLLHRLAGPLAFGVVMWGLFVAIFTLAAPIMDAAEGLVLWLGAAVAELLPAGLLHDVWAEGIVAGVGGVVIFVPQIAFLLILLALLEASGYLARGAFILDRLLGRVGLHGRSFVPLLTSHACAIPGIMAARSIPDARERLATMLVAPFMACSARLPVYGLLIAVFFGHLAAWQQGTILAGLYVGGILAAVVTALALRKGPLKGASSSFLIELPPYRWPTVGAVLRTTWRGVRAFLVKAGTVILALSVVLWVLMTFPRLPEERAAAIAAAHGVTLEQLAEAGAAAEAEEEHNHDSEHEHEHEHEHDEEAEDPIAAAEHAISQARLAHSVAGRLGNAMEPALAPLGLDGQIGIGLIGSFAAREVFISTMGVVYGVGSDDEETAPLAARMQAATRADGTPVWTTLTAVVVLVWFVLAMQCLSTVAVMVRETGGWRWPLIQLVGMNGLAYLVCLGIWQIGSRL